MRVISLSLSLSLLCRHTSLNFFLARTGGGQSGQKSRKRKRENSGLILHTNRDFLLNLSEKRKREREREREGKQASKQE